ncbi:MAG: hydantoinase/oxoprolinase N-terminal domain-containing protein, partial [Betaproteobacteria bacterium]
MAAGKTPLQYRFAFDIGGTFTDLVLLGSDGSVLTAKVLTGVDDVVRPIRTGLLAMLKEHGLALTQVTDVVVGATTAVTNLVIERKGAITGLITTAGFRDVLEIARELRYDLYDLTAPGPDA